MTETVVWPGVEIAHWFIDHHLQDWHQVQGCDGIDLARIGEDYCYLWVEAFVDQDLQVFFLLDVRTHVDHEETRDFLYVTAGVDGFECQWHQQPLNFSAPVHQHTDRLHAGLTWMAGLIDDHITEVNARCEPHVEVVYGLIATPDELAETLLEHEDRDGCCECGGDHTCQDCPVFTDKPSSSRRRRP